MCAKVDLSLSVAAFDSVGNEFVCVHLHGERKIRYAIRQIKEHFLDKIKIGFIFHVNEMQTIHVKRRDNKLRLNSH